MQKTHFLTALAVLCAACGSDPVDELPSSCDESDRVGTYRLTFEEKSGDCWDIPSQLMTLPASADCDVISGPNYSEKGCRWLIHTMCPYEAGEATDARIESTAQLEQRDSRGDVVTGTAFISIEDREFCDGTFAVRYERQ